MGHISQEGLQFENAETNFINCSSKHNYVFSAYVYYTGMTYTYTPIIFVFKIVLIICKVYGFKKNCNGNYGPNQVNLFSAEFWLIFVNVKKMF